MPHTLLTQEDVDEANEALKSLYGTPYAIGYHLKIGDTINVLPSKRRAA